MEQSYIEKIYNFYLWSLTVSDPRTKGWLLVDSPLPTLYLASLYLVIVWIGPKLMQNRKPYNLKYTLVIYNFSMSLLNLYIFIEYFTATKRYNYFCEPCRLENHPDELRVVNATWWYYFSKVIEFADTFFFILRKKNNQLTFLHIYHHSSMFSYLWMTTKWFPAGSTFFPAMVNSAIHVVMYFYYGLAALGPSLAPYLWWKKYLTQLQLLQFAVIFGMSVNSLRLTCDYPLWVRYYICIYMISFIILFGSFYIKAYKQKHDEAIRRASINCEEKLQVNGSNGLKKYNENKKIQQNGFVKKYV